MAPRRQLGSYKGCPHKHDKDHSHYRRRLQGKRAKATARTTTTATAPVRVTDIHCSLELCLVHRCFCHITSSPTCHQPVIYIIHTQLHKYIYTIYTHKLLCGNTSLQNVTPESVSTRGPMTGTTR
ncbi:hypothetical protein JG687_00012716 [Phytophthora cactorum]|uniref:Uncharacterized protein n=1 Tax=Phytophthora cactorum TaxID=29920 RepID=A0A8T1U6D5_9STRA|nr:hypothetical protein JG687_00012716 [Phytophthora cactorum]